MISEREIARSLRTTIDTYRRELGVDYRAHVPRIAFEIRLAFGASPKPVGETTVCDVGAGIGLFTVGCAALGAKRVILVDDSGITSSRSSIAGRWRCMSAMASW
jgi:predicted RNA methylase